MTAIAMFVIPMEIKEWSAYDTGLYNELEMEGLIEALKAEGRTEAASVLETGAAAISSWSPMTMARRGPSASGM